MTDHDRIICLEARSRWLEGSVKDHAARAKKIADAYQIVVMSLQSMNGDLLKYKLALEALAKERIR